MGRIQLGKLGLLRGIKAGRSEHLAQRGRAGQRWAGEQLLRAETLETLHRRRDR